MPSVAMNGGSFSRVISRPLARPQTMPTARPTSQLIQMGTPAMAAMTATVPVRATTDPMDRSIPAVMMVNVTPMPMSVVVLVCRARLRTLRMVKKFFAVIEKTANSTTTAPKVRNLSRAIRDRPGAAARSWPCGSLRGAWVSLMVGFSLPLGATGRGEASRPSLPGPPQSSGFPPAWCPSSPAWLRGCPRAAR